LHPYSNLTCISSWYICMPNIIWIHPTINEKMNGNSHYHECDGRTDRRTDGWTDGEPDRHHHTVIRTIFNGRIKSTRDILNKSINVFLQEKLHCHFLDDEIR
jgi:hypothetical protein